MKCKECNTVDCPFRTTDAEKECQFHSSVIQVLDEWQGVRIQAAIAAMQGLLANPDRKRPSNNYGDTRFYTAIEIADEAVWYADALIEKLKKK